MTGWRIGFLGGEKKLVEKALMVQTHSTSCTSSISQKAAVAALKTDDSVAGRMIAEFAKRREFVIDYMKKADGVNYIEPMGAFYLFMDFRKIIDANKASFADSEALCTKLLQEHNVAAIPGGAFGAEGWLRISYAASLDEIKKGLSRINDFIKKYS